MPQVINTNIASLNAQRNLNASQSALKVALQRLSSGLRINSAKDDAAGLAIATRQTTQIRGLSVAIRNANDAISLAQTAEGALGEMVNALQRMSELATQAASYNTTMDRASLNQEVRQLIDELSRIVNHTRFNGQKILDGSFSGDFQVGTGVAETINVAVSNMSPTTMGVATNFSTVDGLSNSDLATRMARTYRAALNNATVEGVSVANVAANSNSINKINSINAVTSSTGVTAFGYGNSVVGANFDPAAAAAAVDAGALVINGVSIGAAAAGANRGASADNLVAAINAKTAEHGVVAARVNDVNADGTSDDSAIVLFNRSGAAITVTANTSVDADIALFFSAGTTSVGAGQNGAIVLNDTLGDTTLSYDSAATGLAISGVSGASTTLADAAVSAQTVTTAAAANLALLAFGAALDSINSERAALGAKQNRLESVVANLQTVRENVSAARSRIQDADFAEETAALTRAQILQQAGVAMLAQANAVPNTVLALLRG